MEFERDCVTALTPFATVTTSAAVDDRLRRRVLSTEWLLLRRCNLPNIGGRVYVTVRVRVSVRFIFSITWPRPDTVTYV